MLKKNFLLILAVIAMACTKSPVDEPAPEPGLSGVYLDGECIVPIGSTFMGGSISDPSKGNSHRCHMYEKPLKQDDPLMGEVVPVVTIVGFRHADVAYSFPGQFIDGISIDVAELDVPLLIPLDQGEYKGGYEMVSSVSINEYDHVTNDEGKIDIVISLKDGRSLRVFYRGKILFDGYI